jgi:His-Xaa-Ser system protein HxsD
MPQAVTNPQEKLVELVVDFDASTQTLGALEAAAYRLIGTATCQIDRVADRLVCRLTQDPRSKTARRELSADVLKSDFLSLVVDENLRARVSRKTEALRNVIVALAFGSLATSQTEPR